MLNISSHLCRLLAGIVLATAVAASVAAAPPEIKSKNSNAPGFKMHYLEAGNGEPVLLLHGYAQTSLMWRPLMAELAKTNRVIAPDLRGFGDSAKPDSGYDKKSMAKDVHALAAALGLKRAAVVGHAIRLIVAYAYSAPDPDGLSRIVLMG